MELVAAGEIAATEAAWIRSSKEGDDSPIMRTIVSFFVSRTRSPGRVITMR
jgi:hypothetical protein